MDVEALVDTTPVGGHAKQKQGDDEALFFGHLRRGASMMQLGDDAQTTRSDSQDARKAKEEEAEEEEEKVEAGKAKEASRQQAGSMGEEEEEGSEGNGKSTSKEEQERIEQMRRDEALARQLQIQFLREEAGNDEELLRQLNILVQAENEHALTQAQGILSDSVEGLIECAICCDEKPANQIYQYYQCRHRYCVECLKEYYATHINEGNVKLRCPYPNCSTVIQPIQISAVADTELMRKYKQFSWFEEVKSNPNTRWCTKPGCETVLTRVSEDNQRVVCSGCHTDTCFLCGDEWHEGKSCQDNRQEKIKLGLADTSVEDYTKNSSLNVRICPRCAVPIEKNKGCNTVTCAFCSTAFCWLCGEVMTPGHFSKKGPCKGKDGESKVLKATVYTIIAGMIITLPLWIGPAYTVYKIKQRKKRRQALAASATGSGPDLQPPASSLSSS